MRKFTCGALRAPRSDGSAPAEIFIPALVSCQRTRTGSGDYFHELPAHLIEIGEFVIKAQLIIHPNPTIGYRIQARALLSRTCLIMNRPWADRTFPYDRSWTSGYTLAEGTDLLIHDTQYTDEEYKERIGFGHSSIEHAFRFAKLSDVKHFVPFHHDPTHNDDQLDRIFEATLRNLQPSYLVTPSREGMALEVA